MTNWQTNTKSDSSILEQNAFSFLLKSLKDLKQQLEKKKFLRYIFSFYVPKIFNPVHIHKCLKEIM